MLVALAATACGGDDNPANAADSGAAATSDQPSAERPDSLWGPLAVVSGGEGSDDALIFGTIHVGDGCVLLNEQGDDVLLVWPSDKTSWNPATEVVSFDTRRGTTLELHEGDTVSLGGGGTSVAEGGLSAAEFLASVDWVSEPDPSCVPEIRWFVGDVIEAPQPGNQG